MFPVSESQCVQIIKSMDDSENNAFPKDIFPPLTVMVEGKWGPSLAKIVSSGSLCTLNRSLVKMKVTPTGPPTSERERIVLCHPETLLLPPGWHAHARAKGGGDGGWLEAAASVLHAEVKVGELFLRPLFVCCFLYHLLLLLLLLR